MHFLIGNLLANTGLAVANYVKGNGVPYFIPVIAADELTQRTRMPNVLRIAGYTGSQMHAAAGRLGATSRATSKVATISQDYTYRPRAVPAASARPSREDGGKVLQQFWHPLNTADFSPYLGQLANLGAGRHVRHGDRRRRHALHPAVHEFRAQGKYPARRRHEPAPTSP